MLYLIYDGGNIQKLPWEVRTSGRTDTNYRVNYAGHHKRRTLEIEKHIDTQSFAWKGAPNSSSWDQLDIVTGDELATHLLGAGTMIDYVVFHVKSVGAGTIAPFVLLDDDAATRYNIVGTDGKALTIDLSVPGHYYGVLPSVTTNTITVTIPQQTVTVNLNDFKAGDQTVTGATGKATIPATKATAPISGIKPAPMLISYNGIIGFKFTAEKDDDRNDIPFIACVGVYAALKDFWDEHECECVSNPCVTEYPETVCAITRTCT